MALGADHRVEAIAVELVLTLVIDKSVAATDPPVLDTYERVASATLCAKPNAVITLSNRPLPVFVARFPQTSLQTF